MCHCLQVRGETMKTRVLFYWVLFAIPMLSCSEVVAQSSIAIGWSQELEFNNDWCSVDEEFRTLATNLTTYQSSCGLNSLKHNQWFRFKSSETGQLQLTISVGGKRGTLEYPMVSLRDEKLNELSCKRSDFTEGDLTMQFSGLEPGKTHYVEVFSHFGEDHSGSFAMCIDDEISNDFKEGAMELTHQSQWCSGENAFNLSGATPEQIGSSCQTGGPKMDRWFTFTATSEELESSLFQHCQSCSFVMTLWDDNLRELDCQKIWNSSQSNLEMYYPSLVKGRKYFLSVDQTNQTITAKDSLSFSLCLKNGKRATTKKGLNVVMGKLLYPGGVAYFDGTVFLLNKNKVPVDSTHTNHQGKFFFNNLSPRNTYWARTVADNPNLKASIFLTDYKGTPVRKTVEVATQLYGFESLPKGCNNQKLLDCNDISISVSAGKAGMIGKVVQKDEPISGINNLNIYLLDRSENLVDSTVTNELGEFQFLNIASSEDFTIKVEKRGIDLLVEIYLFNDRNQAVATANGPEEADLFVFKKLPALKPTRPQKKNVDAPLDEATFFAEQSTQLTAPLTRIIFGKGESELPAKSREALNKVANYLRTTDGFNIELSGHSDNAGETGENLALSEKRAVVVKDYLVEQGVSEKRILCKAFGDSQPVADNETEEGRESNRRVDFRILVN